MKKIIIYVFVLSSLLTLSSCHTDSNDDSSSLANQFIDHYVQEAQEREESQIFDVEDVGTDGSFKVIRDTTTDVMYMWAKAGYAGGFTVMLDPETGLPLTYSRFLELSNNHPVKGK